MAAQETFELLCQHAREAALLESVNYLLEWDERTIMPLQAGAYRAEQVTLLSALAHQRQTDPRIGGWLDELAASPLAADPHSDTGATIRELRRKYDKKTKLPQALVEELARTSILGQQAWGDARKNDDFKSFKPLLEKTMHLKRQQADCLGFKECRYDALLDEYEPAETTSNVARVLEELRKELVPLVAEIAASGKSPNKEILARSYPTAEQQTFGTAAGTAVGFDFERGRLDVTLHPFCSTMGPHDCRITTRYNPKHFNEAFFGILHEAGHGIYEQGLRPAQFGLPPGEAISLGIHESQSRMWENLVGRSKAFWHHFYPQAQKAFPEALGATPLDDFFFAINDVRPSLIRVEADEATYNLHILVRFELEQALINDDLPVGDLPGAWKEKYRGYLGIEPPNDANGVLQDIHWSAGLVGYFATYSLGNLYASQFFQAAQKDLGDLNAMFARGEFLPLKNWLVENIHRHGKCYSAAELVERVTGRPLGHADLMAHLRGKFGPLFGLK
jgi:carboxypeptidase Taq